ncbi:MAG: YggS family pyridoxal phosphate-dependent enzyme [Deferribacteraceae bacterium]|jgi:pyridoxal phosphate enzyme (YggS family)|nr:YggS family pyridoxal phosphate-dependent enzyme [Deferribacteraceae bacterium]
MTFAELKKRVDNAARTRGARGEEITIVVVSKGQSAEAINNLAAQGAKIFGESRLQEALLKLPLFTNVQLHFIGRLQSNKVKKITELFTMIQSVDSLSIARQIDNAARECGKVQEVLLQVNNSGEKQKGGIAKEYFAALYEDVVKLSNISVKGLMMIPPHFDNPEKNRLLFRDMFNIYTSCNLPYLSMGMSGDFETAVEEGANMVRVGSALFER